MCETHSWRFPARCSLLGVCWPVAETAVSALLPAVCVVCLVCVWDVPLQLLPGGSRALYELWADLGELLLKGGGTPPGAWPD